MKYIYHIVENGSYIQSEYSNIDNCMNELMRHLFNTLGNGDNENGGKGSLWRCSQSIYDTIRSGNVYEYANCKFWVEFVDDPPKELTKKYILRFSAVVDNSVIVEAKNREELKEKRKFWEDRMCRDLAHNITMSTTNWCYDGNINNEGEEEVK